MGRGLRCGRPTKAAVAALATLLCTSAMLSTSQSPAAANPVTLVDQTIVSTGNLIISNSDDVSGPGDEVTLAGSTTISAGGAIAITAADTLSVSSGTTLSGASVLLDTAQRDNDGLGDIMIAGTLESSGGLSAVAGAGDNTLTIDYPAGATLSGPLTVDGGGGADRLDVRTAGSTDPFLTIADNQVGQLAGTYRFGDRPEVAFANIEALSTAVNLAVSLTDGQTVADPGAAITYSLVVSNLGSLGIGPVTVTDVLPPTIIDAIWDCVASPGSSCSTADGSGSVSTTVALAAGGTASFAVTGTISAPPGSTITNTASVNPPADVVDLDPLNNTAADATQLRTQQSVSFAALPDREIGSPPFDLSAVATSGLPVTFASSGSCTVTESTVTLVAVGTCAVTASQAGDDTWLPAPPVTRTFEITPAVTVLEVKPVLISINPFSVTIGTVSARLSTSRGPVVGQPVVFSAGGPVCTGVTGGNGVASCAVPLTSLLRLVLAGKVTASFAGSPSHLPSSGTAPLIR